MKLVVSANAKEMGKAAAAAGAQFLREAIASRGEANLIVATGASQFEMLAALVQQPDIDWQRVTGFHLDEYIGLPASHPASFRKYLKERFVDRVALREFHYVCADAVDPAAECDRLKEALAEREIDVAFIGIGENGHLAFNDPPADFETNSPYLIVKLDEACRRQQVGEGWFESLDAVPKEAITMSISQIMCAKAIICSVPDERKAVAVRNTLEGAVTPEVPASKLQEHAACTLFLDNASARLLSDKTRGAGR